jgi:hypothetical protein
MADGNGNLFQQSDPNITDVRIKANNLVKGGNPYETGNELIVDKAKKKALYKNGMTLPASAQRLMEEAKRDIRHSQKLSRNMASGGYNKPTDAAPGATSSHHIVAVGDDRAKDSRMLLFGWGIGINDIDNGVRLPSYVSSTVSSLPNATKHSKIHTDTYYLTVFTTLSGADPSDQQSGRGALKYIKGQILGGIFPY